MITAPTSTATASSAPISMLQSADRLVAHDITIEASTARPQAASTMARTVVSKDRRTSAGAADHELIKGPGPRIKRAADHASLTDRRAADHADLGEIDGPRMTRI